MAKHLRHILSVDQFDKEFIDELFVATDFFRKTVERNGISERAKGRVLSNLFYEPSTRTSSSFFAAMTRLGGSVVPINDVTYSSVSKGEILEDTIRTLACYSDCIVLRHNEVGAATRAAAVSPVPIINAGDGVGEHPTQALLDLFTVWMEQGTLEGVAVTMMGDLKHGRTVHSLAKLLRKFGAQLRFVAPSGLEMPSEYVQIGDAETESLDDVLGHTDVLYVTRVQKERLADPSQVFDYGITLEHMTRAKPTMSLMHPLPRVNEIPQEIDADPRAAYFRQMRYGLFVRMALLDHVLS